MASKTKPDLTSDKKPDCTNLTCKHRPQFSKTWDFEGHNSTIWSVKKHNSKGLGSSKGQIREGMPIHLVSNKQGKTKKKKHTGLAAETLRARLLNKVFLSLQGCLIEVMKLQGDNNYKIPHLGKDRLLREHRLPIWLEVDEHLVRASINNLLHTQSNEALCYDINILLSDLWYVI